MSLPRLWPKHHWFLPLFFQCQCFSEASPPSSPSSDLFRFRRWHLRFGPVRAECSGTLTEDPRSPALFLSTQPGTALSVLTTLAGTFFMSFWWRAKSLGSFFFANVILFVYFGLHQVLVAAYVLFVAAPRLAPWHSGSVAAAWRLSCLTASGILVPLPEINPRSAVLKGRFLALEPLWKSLDYFFFLLFTSVSLSSPSLTLQES